MLQLDVFYALFDKSAKKEIYWNTEISGDAPEKLKIAFVCMDANDQDFTKIFNLKLDDCGHYLSELPQESQPIY